MFMFFCPMIKRINIHALVTKVTKCIHEKSVAGGSTQGIYNVDFAVWIFFPQVFCCNFCGIKGAGNAAGKSDMQDVFAGIQKFSEMLFIFLNIDL